MSRPSSNLRLFVAIHPPHAVARRLLKAAAALELPPHRLVNPEQVHITVQFVGDTPASDLERTIESVERSAAGLPSFALRPQRLLGLPEGGRSRLVAAETDAPAALLEMKRRLVQRLATPPGESRPFRPHLTLLRFRQPTGGFRLERPLPVEDDLVFTVERVTLMKSLLRPQGPLHQEVSGVDLAPAGRGRSAAAAQERGRAGGGPPVHE